MLAFDEEFDPISKTRSWRTSKVIRTNRIKRPTYRITLVDGTVVFASAEHKWLVRTPKGNKLEWMETDKLKTEHKLMKLVDVWEGPQWYDEGYLAGVFDGEGFIQQALKENGGHSARIGFSQNENALSVKARQCLRDLGFHWTETKYKDITHFMILGRRAEFLRLLGQLRPARLLGKFDPEKLGEIHGKEYVKIHNLEYVGESELIALATETKTLVAAGFASHNSAPPTAPSLINDAADHLAGNWPEFVVKPLKETTTAEKDQERVQIALNTMYDLLAREQGKALHRTMAIHGGWSGMMAAKIGLHDDWDMDKPTIKDFYWHPVDPRYLFPDPGSLGKEFIIYRMRRTVGSIRQFWPDWEGQWYAPAGWGFWNQGPDTRPRMNERLPDFMVVDWIEYWDDTYKCFISNGHPVFQPSYGMDLIPHGLGINPFVIRSAGYGDDTGEPHERFRSMLYYVFSMLEAEARLWTQYKWIVEDTAWPVIIAHDSMKPLDLTPASVNYVTDLTDVQKGIRTLREDAVDPKALIDVLGWVQNVIERATYPVILKGNAPSGIRAGYPIAILSTQAKVKFASPSDALKAMMQELAYKTLAIIQNRIQIPVEIIDGYKLMPEDYGKYLGRIAVKMEPNLPTDRAAMIPTLELAVGSLGLPKERALKDLGYEDPVELRELRVAEDLVEDPRVRQIMAEHFLEFLSPDYAAALQEESQSQALIQKLGEQVTLLQAKLQVAEAQAQLQQMQAQQQQMQQQMAGGGMQAPPQGPGGAGPPPEQGGLQGGERPGTGGSPAFGQNPTNPNNMGQGLTQANPMTAARGIASAMRAGRTISDLSTQDTALGNPSEGAGEL